MSWLIERYVFVPRKSMNGSTAVTSSFRSQEDA
jgi:hypothetical protein